MEKRLTDVMKESGFDHRQQRILAVAPGCLFGFPPPNLRQKIERIDCPRCQPVIALAERIAGLADALEQRIADFRKPAEERNRGRRESWRKWRGVPIIGRFVKSPKEEPMPSHEDEPWFAEMKHASAEMASLRESMRRNDPAHWSGTENEKISMELVACLLGKGPSTLEVK